MNAFVHDYDRAQLKAIAPMNERAPVFFVNNSKLKL